MRFMTMLLTLLMLSWPTYAKGSSKSKRTEDVGGYTKKNGTVVKPYKRAPAGTSDAPKKKRK